MGLVRCVGSLKVSVTLLALVFAVVLGGTVVQATLGTAVAQTEVFARLPWVLTLVGVNLVAGAWVHLKRGWEHLGLWGLHLTLAAFCFGAQGLAWAQADLVVGLLPGSVTDRAFVRGAHDDRSVALPFPLGVTAFHVETYPGSAEPSDYVSQVTVGTPPVTAEIRMNQPLRYQGWTIYQSSVQTVGGFEAPVYKLTNTPWAPFPYVVSVLLGLFLVVHLVLRARGTAERSHRG
jgi:hypothetical protein